MQFFLLSVMCVIGAVLAKPALTKQKRDILPGDSRYGTDYHHHHSQESNEVEGVQAAYGPPNYSPGQTIHYQETVQQAVQPAQHYIPAPSVSVSNVEPSGTVDTISNSYLSPVVPVTQASIVYQQPQVVYQQVAQQQEQHPVASQNNAYLAPAAPVVYQQPQVVYQQVAQQQEQHPVASQNNAYLAPAATVIQAPVVYQQPQVVHQQEQHSVASQNNAYLAPAATVAQAPAVQYVPSAPVYTQQVQAVQQRTPVQQQATHHVQQQAVQHVQEQVRHVYQAAQPIVHQQVAQVEPDVQQQQIVYQSEPQTYFGGSENSGFTYQQEQSSNVFQNDYAVAQQNVQESQEVSQLIGNNGGYLY